MDGYIPKEKLTAYERWELAAFAELSAESRAEPPVNSPPAPAPAPEPEALPATPRIPMPTPEEIEGLRADAREIGKTEGFAEGFAAGRDEGLAFARAEAERLGKLADDFTKALAGAEDRLADELLALALEVARQVVRTSIRVKPERIVPVVREAIGLLTSQHGHPTLFLAPEDAELVRRELGDQFGHSAWRISEDSTLARGECRIDNAGSRIDATLATRWRRVVDEIGVQSDWVEDDR